jgi:hypothetical protein
VWEEIHTVLAAVPRHQGEVVLECGGPQDDGRRRQIVEGPALGAGGTDRRDGARRCTDRLVRHRRGEDAIEIERHVPHATNGRS